MNLKDAILAIPGMAERVADYRAAEAKYREASEKIWLEGRYYKDWRDDVDNHASCIGELVMETLDRTDEGKQ